MVSGFCKWSISSALSIAFSLALLGTQPVQGQSFKVIYTFTGHTSAAHPIAGLMIDEKGNLYGTTAWGGQFGGGTVYELLPSRSSFMYSELHDFGQATDGSFPWGSVTIAPGGALYGTTGTGGVHRAGTVFEMRQGSCHSGTCPWTESILHSFTGGDDGRNPQAGVVLDAKGNIYGSNVNGGSGKVGVVYKMTPSHGGWTFQTLYPFTDGQDGANPSSLLLFDAAGNLYGTAATGGNPGCGGFGCGTVYQLTPSGSDWTEHTLYSFQGSTDGGDPVAGLVADNEGNLYGATPGAINGGTVFELSPSAGSWSFNLAYDVVGDGPGPVNNLVRDSAGNLYGSSWGDGLYGEGVVFKLTLTDTGWIYTSLHDFTGGTDGGNAEGGLVMDSAGNLYGTTYQGGLASCGRCGVVYEITP